MNRRFLEAAFFCCALAAGLGHAADVFEGLAPESIGRELTAVLEEAELKCQADKQAGSDSRACELLPGAIDTLAGAKVNAVSAWFQDKRLQRVTVYFPESSYAKVAPTLKSRLGVAKDWTVNIHAGMNAAFKNEILVWESERFTAVLQQYDTKINRSSLIYGTSGAMAELLGRIKATPPGSSRDL